MPPLARFLLRRLLAVPVTLLLMTATLYAITMLAPPEMRAQLYLTRTEQMRGNVLELTERAIERHGLRDPYPQQYVRWLGACSRATGATARHCAPRSCRRCSPAARPRSS
jgi:peptide/nickel transport system permease protein